MINEIKKLLIERKFVELSKLCSNNIELHENVKTVIKNIDTELLWEINDDFNVFMNQENNIYSDEDKMKMIDNDVEVYETAGELFKVLLGAIILQELKKRS